MRQNVCPGAGMTMHSFHISIHHRSDPAYLCALASGAEARGNRIAVLVKRREGAGLWPQPLSGSGYAQIRDLPGGKGLNNGFQISENAGSHPIHDL